MAIISLDRIVARLNGDGYTARVENTGGGCMAVMAGTPVRSEWSACAGPGWVQAGGAHLADTSDFYVGPDGEASGDLPPEAFATVTSEDEAVEAIKRQVMETDTVRAAAYLLRKGAISPDEVLTALEGVQTMEVLPTWR